MADARAYVARLRPALVPIPATPQDGICEICHSSTSSGSRRCRPCAEAQILSPPEILPITLSVHGDLIHRHLRGYKDDGDASTRERMTMRLAALLALFMSQHDECVGPWDLVTCVPSVRRVAMEPVVQKIRRFEDRYRPVLSAIPGAGGRLLDPDQFAVQDNVTGQRVLLLDDTFTTGAKAFSATAALRAAGAQVVGPIVIGRHVNPQWEPSATMLQWLGDREWSDARCCRCAGERRDEGAFL